MEFADIVAGLWGFIVVIATYIIIHNLERFIGKVIKKYIPKKNIEIGKEYNRKGGYKMTYSPTLS